MLISANALQLPLADESVQCIVTSPPYWGLRAYAGKQDLIWGGDPLCVHEWETKRAKKPGRRDTENDIGGRGTYKEGGGPKLEGDTSSGTCVLCRGWRGAFGLEPTIALYIAHTVMILEELKRVLRPDGVLFWNVGDSYYGSGSLGSGGSYQSSPKQVSVRGSYFATNQKRSMRELRDKNLCLIPQRAAIAAQESGWYVRSFIVWTKTNPMPESVVDRPTDAYEPILMLTKREKYFWDGEAVREKVSENTHLRIAQQLANQVGSERAVGKTNGKMKAVVRGSSQRKLSPAGSGVKNNESMDAALKLVPTSRNMRNVWSFSTQGYSGAHFATFPEELPRRCILAATSAEGCCGECGAPLVRMVEAAPEYKKYLGKTLGNHGSRNTEGKARGFGEQVSADYVTIGWKPSCEHNPITIKPCAVLDPFGGSGTTGRVAIELRRRPILVDLAYGRATAEDSEQKREYAKLADRRTRNVQVNLL